MRPRRSEEEILADLLSLSAEEFIAQSRARVARRRAELAAAGVSRLEVRGDTWIARSARGYACYGHAAPSTSRPLRGAIVDEGELGDLGWWEGRGGERAREWLARTRLR